MDTSPGIPLDQQPESFQQGYRYGKRFGTLSPQTDWQRSYRMAGSYAVAYLAPKQNTPSTRHQFIQGFVEGYRATR